VKGRKGASGKAEYYIKEKTQEGEKKINSLEILGPLRVKLRA